MGTNTEQSSTARQCAESANLGTFGPKWGVSTKSIPSELRQPLWDPVDDLSGLPELAQHAVTVDVDPHPQNKEEDTDAKPHVCVPLLRVFRAINQVIGLQESVPYAEGSGFQKDHR